MAPRKNPIPESPPYRCRRLPLRLPYLHLHPHSRRQRQQRCVSCRPLALLLLRILGGGESRGHRCLVVWTGGDQRWAIST